MLYIIIMEFLIYYLIILLDFLNKIQVVIIIIIMVMVMVMVIL